MSQAFCEVFVQVREALQNVFPALDVGKVSMYVLFIVVSQSIT
jgi:hypothetical protein